MSKTKFVLNGAHLTISDIYHLTNQAQSEVEVSALAFEAIEKSKNFVTEEIGRGIVYGVNTGFGPMASRIIPVSDLVHLQENLIRSHAVGMGKPVEDSLVYAAMIVRLNTLCRGYSGVSKELVLHLTRFINERIIPIVPEHGAVGASGDLVQLAHIALALIGEGEVVYKGRRQQTAKLLRQLEITPYKLLPKEGLSLINGTSMMTGIACLVCRDASRILDIATRLGAFAFEIMYGYGDALDAELHMLRPHAGQIKIARRMRDILAGSKRVKARLSNEAEASGERVTEISRSVQEFYSLRCIPQILGPVADTLENTRYIVETEINSVTDNPIVDYKRRLFLHGGNFHGDYVSTALDQLKMTLIKLSMLSERRINFFLNSAINKCLPPFINLKTPGLTLALQGLQFVATSTAAQSQSLGYPHSLHSISTNADNQDVVSMGTDAALLAAKVVENAYIVLSIELVTLSQAVDYLQIREELSPASQMLYDDMRKLFPAVIEDRVLGPDLSKIVSFLRRASVFTIA